MTNIVPYSGAPAPISSIELAPQVWKLAEKIAGTDFVPKALRGKPEAVMAAMLAGHEAGISPMQALAKIHIIEGRPAMSSELMVALVMRQGHELYFEDVSSTKVTAVGRRREWPDRAPTKVTWTLDDARTAGLLGKQVWKSYPRAMLRARATGELCRMMFPDVLAGISYTIEEVTDMGDAVDVLELGPPEVVDNREPAPGAPKRTAKARQAATSAAIPQSEPETRPPAPAGQIPDLPPPPSQPASPESATTTAPIDASQAQTPEHGDHPETVTEAHSAPPTEPVDWETGDWGDGPPPVGDAKRYNGPQLIAIKLAERFGIGTGPGAREGRLEAISTILGRPVESSKEMTPDEIQIVISVIDAWPEGEPFGPADDEPDSAEDVPADAPPPVAPAPRPAPPAPATSAPETWTADQWRTFLGKRKVKVTEALREAQRLAAALPETVSIVTIEDLVGSAVTIPLVGWAEDLSLERSSK